MWAVTTRTAYAVGGAWGRDKNGVHQWIVGVKATFDILPDGGLALAEEQAALLPMPEYNGEDGSSSLSYDADLVGPKPTTDVLVNGTAYAPKGRPTTEFSVSMRVGSIRKQIKVLGNRRWEAGVLGSGRSPMEPIATAPIVYERAYGGFDQSSLDPREQRMDTRNPVGCGLVLRPGMLFPNFEYPGGKVDKAGPAGFGALASYWSPRREFAGTYDEAWQKSRQPLFPVDWDPRHLLCAPADQRPQMHLTGGESVELINLTPNGLLRFLLPRKRFSFRTLFNTGAGKRAIPHDGELATVIIEPEYPRLMLVWLSTLTCTTDVDYLDETIVTEAPGQ